MIFHIAREADWRAAVDAGSYRVSTLGRTLEEEGFIHCSRSEQVLGVAERFYGGEDALLLLTVDPARLTSPLRNDEVAPGAVFPHVYGPVNWMRSSTSRRWAGTPPERSPCHRWKSDARAARDHRQARFRRHGRGGVEFAVLNA